MTIGKNQYLIIPNGHECCHDGEILRINDYAVLLGEGCRSFVVCSQGIYLLMLGYAVDAFCDESDEEKICTRILQNYIQNKSLLESTRSLSGRWAIFIFKNDIILAFNDACAFKQVYYLSHDGYSAFASQARYLAKVFGVEGDKEAMEYIKLAREKDNEFSWPLSCTQYKGIRRLLPNHIYNSQIKAATRDQYIPSHFKHSYLQAAREYAGILSNSLRLLTQKGSVATTLTAGLDSRQVLSCCDSLKERIKVITFCYKETPLNATDIVVPAKICERQKYYYQLIKCEPITDDFHTRYQQHCEDGHKYWEQIAQAVENGGIKDFFLVKGSCNEIVNRCNGVLNNKDINEKLLMKVFNIPFTEFSFHEISNWMRDARDYCKKRHMCLLDLFYWEHRMGSWCASSINETDMVCETFAPFNLRAYIDDIYQLPIGSTMPPRYLFFREVMNNNNPEYLKEQINNNRDYALRRRAYFFIKYRWRSLYRQLINKKK